MASLHQAILEELPTRLEFYEHWLNLDGLREGTIGLAAMLAVISFLRQEGPGYAGVVGRAGALAAEWHLGGLSRLRRASVERLPATLRARAVLGVTRHLVRLGYGGSNARISLRRGRGRLTITHSLFCEVRHPGTEPRCGFYAAAVAYLMVRFEIPASVDVVACRAAGADECAVGIALGGDAEAESAA